MSPQFLQGFPSSDIFLSMLVSVCDTEEAHLQLIIGRNGDPEHTRTCTYLCAHTSSFTFFCITQQRRRQQLPISTTLHLVRPRSHLNKGYRPPQYMAFPQGSHTTSLLSTRRWPEHLNNGGRTECLAQSNVPPPATRKEHKPWDVQPDPCHTSAWAS